MFDHLKHKTTDRGFTDMVPLLGLGDREQVQIYESSLATQAAIWLSVMQPKDRNYPLDGVPEKAVIQLDLETAGHLRDQLDWLIRNHYQVAAAAATKEP